MRNKIIIAVVSFIFGIVLRPYVLAERDKPAMVIALPVGYCGDFLLRLVEDKTTELEYPRSYTDIYVVQEGEIGIQILVPHSPVGWSVTYGIYPDPKNTMNLQFKAERYIGDATLYDVQPMGYECSRQVNMTDDLRAELFTKFKSE